MRKSEIAYFSEKELAMWNEYILNESAVGETDYTKMLRSDWNVLFHICGDLNIPIIYGDSRN